jgi:hypothetical protein
MKNNFINRKRRKFQVFREKCCLPEKVSGANWSRRIKRTTSKPTNDAKSNQKLNVQSVDSAESGEIASGDDVVTKETM